MQPTVGMDTVNKPRSQTEMQFSLTELNPSGPDAVPVRLCELGVLGAVTASPDSLSSCVQRCSVG